MTAQVRFLQQGAHTISPSKAFSDVKAQAVWRQRSQVFFVRGFGGAPFYGLVEKCDCYVTPIPCSVFFGYCRHSIDFYVLPLYNLISYVYAWYYCHAYVYHVFDGLDRPETGSFKP